MSHWCINQFEYDGMGATWSINPLFATKSSSGNTLDLAMSTRDEVAFIWLHRAISSISSSTDILINTACTKAVIYT